MASFSIEAMVRGYHVYNSIWTAAIGEEFPCKREVTNMFDSIIGFLDHSWANRC